VTHRLIYLDTSAALKLFKQEAESAALMAWLSTEGSALVVTCDLSRTEVRRGLHAAGASPKTRQQAEDWLDSAAVLRLPPALFDQAGRLNPGGTLRTLDAIHVAAAMSVAPAVIAFVAYDKRLLEAAAAVGLRTLAPT
jgi:predicted nucleic acid-binding protein